jgi:Na+-driven multidrug efflux pump
VVRSPSLRSALRRRSPHDREILAFAVPALGALAAGPLYVLADTAIVGHLGTPQLGALALAGTLVTALLQLSDFLSYGTTAQVARLHGAGEVRYLAGAMVAALVVFAPIALAASTLTALWAALLALMAVRLLTTGARFARGRWAVLGAG